MSHAPIKVIDNLVIDALKDLSDEVFQHRVWVIGSPTEVSSMYEVTAALLDDSGLAEALEKNVITYSPQIDQELRELRRMLRNSLEQELQHTTKEVIGTVEWRNIRRKAMRLLENINSRH